MNDKLLKWASARQKKLIARKILAQHDAYIAQVDYRSVLAGKPTGACLERFAEWQGMQLKERPTTDNT